ncbi:MAG: OadG family protein [Spongiibacteraceae bacterium]
MQDSLVQQGVELMLYGMGTVFVFLVVLILATTAMSSLMQRFVKPEQIPLPPQPRGNPHQAKDEQLVAVITAAIHKYRSRHQR